jgi:hypothetical protein
LHFRFAHAVRLPADLQRPFVTSGLAGSGHVDRIAQCPLALHENIMVAATLAIGAFVFRPRQLIGYDRLRSQPA